MSPQDAVDARINQPVPRELVTPVYRTSTAVRAICIGTSIYANDLRTADNVVVDHTGPVWDYTKMADYMQGHGGRSWFTYMCLMSAGRILPLYNAAESGSELPSQVTRFDRDVVAHDPDIVFLGDATNDINNSVASSSIRANIIDMIGRAKAAGILPVLVGSSPRSDFTTKNTVTTAHNNWLRRYAWANGLPFIDPFAAIRDPATGGISATYSSDGLHPNALGGKVAGQRAIEELEAALLSTNTRAALAPFVIQSTDAGNLLPISFFTTDANSDGLADSWAVSAAAGKSLVTDARLTAGKFQQMTVNANGQVIQHGLAIGGTVAVGHKVALSGLIEVDAAAGSLQYNVGLYTVGQAGVWASNPIGYGGAS